MSDEHDRLKATEGLWKACREASAEVDNARGAIFASATLWRDAEIKGAIESADRWLDSLRRDADEHIEAKKRYDVAMNAYKAAYDEPTSAPRRASNRGRKKKS